MNNKKWLKIWFLVSLFIPLVFIFNYVIDPLAYNDTFRFSFNKYKSRLDERSEKFTLMKEGNFNSYIFGSSRNGVIDPDRIDLYLNDANSINISFASCTVDEIDKYVNWILGNKDNTKYMFFPIDLFAFSDDFYMKGVLPKELSENKPFFKIIEYFSYEMLKKSIATIKHSLNYKQDKEEEYYQNKGMRYYKEYLKITNEKERKEWVLEHVTKGHHKWYVERVSDKKINLFYDILKKLDNKGIKYYIYTNPIKYQTILVGKSYLVQLDLIERFVKDGLTIYDFNNINRVTKENIYFKDGTHFNYEVANCIIDFIFSNYSQCGDEFGYIVTSKNIVNYKKLISQKYVQLQKKVTKRD